MTSRLSWEHLLSGICVYAVVTASSAHYVWMLATSPGELKVCIACALCCVRCVYDVAWLLFVLEHSTNVKFRMHPQDSYIGCFIPPIKQWARPNKDPDEARYSHSMYMDIALLELDWCHPIPSVLWEDTQAAIQRCYPRHGNKEGWRCVLPSYYLIKQPDSWHACHLVQANAVVSMDIFLRARSLNSTRRR